jgi:hypothetical protein
MNTRRERFQAFSEALRALMSKPYGSDWTEAIASHFLKIAEEFPIGWIVDRVRQTLPKGQETIVQNQARSAIACTLIECILPFPRGVAWANTFMSQANFLTPKDRLYGRFLIARQTEDEKDWKKLRQAYEKAGRTNPGLALVFAEAMSELLEDTLEDLPNIARYNEELGRYAEAAETYLVITMKTRDLEDMKAFFRLLDQVSDQGRVFSLFDQITTWFQDTTLVEEAAEQILSEINNPRLRAGLLRLVPTQNLGN